MFLPFLIALGTAVTTMCGKKKYKLCFVGNFIRCHSSHFQSSRNFHFKFIFLRE